LIKGEASQVQEWGRFVQPSGRNVRLLLDPGVDDLTRYEVHKLQALSKRFEDEEDWAVADYTHAFEEWIKNRPAETSSRPIPPQDILAATGHAADAAEIMAESRAEGVFDMPIDSAKRK
jgi:hypothetical protein